MSVVVPKARARWLALAVVVAVLLATPIVLAHWPVRAARVDTATLVRRILASADRPYQGSATVTGSAGLPSLPNLAGVIALLDGETTLRAWYAAPHRSRIDALTGGGERDVYQTATGETTWDSGSGNFTTITGSPPARLPRAADFIPPELARRLVDDARQSATATGHPLQESALPARRIAGIGAAGVRLHPTDPDTSVGFIDVWADPTTGLPLRVELTPAEAVRPIMVVTFVSVEQTAPGASVTAVPAPPAGVGSTTLTPAQVRTQLDNVSGFEPPTTIGTARRVNADVRGVAAYGIGLERFIAVALPADIAQQWYEGAMAAGGTESIVGGDLPLVVEQPTLDPGSVGGGVYVFVPGEIVTPVQIVSLANPLLSVEILLVDGYGIALAGPLTSAAMQANATALANALSKPKDFAAPR